MELGGGLKLILLYINLICVRADYDLSVTFHSVSNPENRLQSGPNCCDLNEECGFPTCDSFFSFCLRPFGAALVDVDLRDACNGSAIMSTDVMEDTGSVSSFSDTVFGVANPVVLTGPEWPMSGVQIFLELLDQDTFTADDLIDRFGINISIPINTMISRTSYNGAFGVAVIELSYSVACSNHFTGSDCGICEQGFTGGSCDINIDDCMGVSCELNHQCVDGLLNYTCECQPGYTGPDCLTDINECMDVDCNNGTCIDRLASFSCECDVNFIGELCDIVNICVGVDCGVNQRCVDGHLNYTCECEPEYTGPDCLLALDGCANINCNNGQCINRTACSCNPGFIGDYCEIEQVSSNSNSTMLIIITSVVAFVVIVLILTAVTITLILCIRVRLHKRVSIDGNHNLGSDHDQNHTATDVTFSLTYRSSGPASDVANHDYDYPNHFVQENLPPGAGNRYAVEQCPAYDNPVLCEPCPAYVTVKPLDDEDDDEDHIYY